MFDEHLIGYGVRSRGRLGISVAEDHIQDTSQKKSKIKTSKLDYFLCIEKLNILLPYRMMHFYATC